MCKFGACFFRTIDEMISSLEDLIATKFENLLEFEDYVKYTVGIGGYELDD